MLMSELRVLSEIMSQSDKNLQISVLFIQLSRNLRKQICYFQYTSAKNTKSKYSDVIIAIFNVDHEFAGNYSDSTTLHEPKNSNMILVTLNMKKSIRNLLRATMMPIFLQLVQKILRDAIIGSKKILQAKLNIKEDNP